MEQKKRSPITIIVFAVLIGLLTIALLNGAVRPVPVVAAKGGLAPGTLLTADLLEVRSVPAGGVPEDAFRSLDEVEGQMLTVGRAPGDLITAAVVGESAASGIPSQLEAGHVAVAIRVDLASGVAGLLREGQTVTLIGMLTPDVLMNTLNTRDLPGLIFNADGTFGSGATNPNATPEPTPTPEPLQAPIARIALSGLKILLVPQSFRYQELPPSSDSNDQLFSSAMTVSAAQNGSVIVLDVPTQPVEIAPGLSVSPAALVAALDEYGKLHLALEPADGLQSGAGLLTLNLGELYETLNAGTGE